MSQNINVWKRPRGGLKYWNLINRVVRVSITERIFLVYFVLWTISQLKMQWNCCSF